MDIQLTATQKPAPETPPTDAERQVNPRRLADIDVQIIAPLGRFVVLGAAPIGRVTSAFVVHVSPLK